MNPYKTLGVDKGANRDEIKAAFRKRANETHPDKGGDSEAFLAVSSAFELLSDQKARDHFDRTGERPEKVNIQDVAKTAVGVTIQEIILSPSFNPEHVNLIETAREKLRNKSRAVISQANANVRDLEGKRERFLRASDRLSSSDPDDVIKMTMERAVFELTKTIDVIQEEIKTEQSVCKVALKILDNYQYEHASNEQKIEQYLRGGSSPWVTL